MPLSLSPTPSGSFHSANAAVRHDPPHLIAADALGFDTDALIYVTHDEEPTP